MTRSHHAEMAVVEGRQLRLVQPLDDREDGGVDEADSSIRVLLVDGANSTIVR